MIMMVNIAIQALTALAFGTGISFSTIALILLHRTFYGDNNNFSSNAVIILISTFLLTIGMSFLYLVAM